MVDMSLVDLGKRLLESAKHGETEEVRTLMTNGAPFTTDWLGTSPLHMAAQYGHVATAEVLLRGGISRDARTKVDRTPLHIAAQEGHLDIVKLLISHGAEVDAKDMLKMTPLHWAAERGHYYVAKYLLKHNTNINALSKFEKTPLDIAEDNQHLHLIELLSRHAVESHSPSGRTKLIQITQPTLSSNPPTLKTTTVPLFFKSDSLPSAIQRTLSHTVEVSSPVTSVTSPTIVTGTIQNPVKSPSISKPVLLRANLANIQKTTAATTSLHTTSSSDSEDSESTEKSNTNVLATLAALAEATAPNSSISTSEALQWLEMNGITMLPPDNSTVVASALEGGQTVSLTEAGKLALTWVKEHQNLNNNSANVASPAGEKSETSTVTSSPNTTSNQKVITIVTDHTRIPSIISSPQTPIVVLSSPNMQTDSTPPLKKFKTSPAKKDVSETITNGNTVSTSGKEDEERLKLKKELETFKKQAELYKAQLLLKEHEAEVYKKQLEQIKTLPSVDQ